MDRTLWIRSFPVPGDRGPGQLAPEWVADIVGDSLVDPSRMMDMRGTPEPIKRSQRARDPQLAERLWSVSEQLTETRFPRNGSAPVAAESTAP